MNRSLEVRRYFLGLSVLCTLLFAPVSFAQDDDGDEDHAESTIRLMGAAEAELPDAVTKEITLPPAAVENAAAVEKAARGSEEANANRERRENGQARADEARENGAEMSENARNNRENRGRFEDRPTPPDRPEPPKGPPGS